MVSFVVRLKFAQEDRAEVVDAVRRLAEASRKEPGCVSYIPHHSEEDLDTIVIYEQYVDEEALKAHRDSEHFKKYAVGGLFQRMRERAVENLIALF
jgi:quinol monooxygenase YgiN